MAGKGGNGIGGNGGDGAPGKIAKAARFVTPGGVIAILVAVLGVDDALDRNCRAASTAAAGTRAVVSVDDELGRKTNGELKRQLLRNLRAAEETC